MGGEERTCHTPDFRCGVLPPDECPEMEPYRSFDCLKVTCELTNVTELNVPLPQLPEHSTANLSGLLNPAGTLTQDLNMTKNPADMKNLERPTDLNNENGNNWIFFVTGIVFALLVLLLIYILYVRCCKKKQQQQQQPPFNFNVLAPKERRSEEKIQVVSKPSELEAPETPVEIPAEKTRVPGKNHYENVVNFDLISEEELNPPQVKILDPTPLISWEKHNYENVDLISEEELNPPQILESPPLISMDTPILNSSNDDYEDIIVLDSPLGQSSSPARQEKSFSPDKSEKSFPNSPETPEGKDSPVILASKEKIRSENINISVQEDKNQFLSPTELASAIESAQKKLMKTK